MEEAPFGGTPGQWLENLEDREIPKKGYRVIPGDVWWEHVHKLWRINLAAIREGVPTYEAPFIAPITSTGLYLTDKPSLQGLIFPEDFASRLTLPGNAQEKCKLYGCAVIQFCVPSAPLIKQGLTKGNAREWLLGTNIRLHDKMKVSYIDVSSRKAPRRFLITL